MTTGDNRASVGVQPHLTDRTISVTDLAKLVADRNLASIFVCEHTHIPVASKSFSPRGILPEWCKRIPDPYITLATISATTGLEIGTAVALVAEHDPIILAKVIATLDQLSGGRFVLGVGWGWNREEFESHASVPANKRLPLLREKLEVMQRIWADDEATYSGQYVSLKPTWSWPKPTRRAGPPVLIGATGEARNLERVTSWADGWIPMYMGLTDDSIEQFTGDVAALRAMWDKAGRDPSLVDLTLLHPPDSVDGLRRALDRADALGVRRILIQINEESLADAEAILDRTAAAIATR
jgi:probable F420-dependent oxidoreductase